MTPPSDNPFQPNLSPPANGIAARAHYYEAASSWAQDTHAALRSSRRTAWIIAGVAIGVASLQAIAIAFLLPLKQSVPYTITVDRETGYVQTTRGVNLGNLSETDAIAQSFIVQYVLARETFEATDYRENYRKTMMWSQGGAETEYARDWDQSNPNGAAQRYRPTTRVKVTVKSVTILGPRSALVRFDTEQTEGPSSGGMRQPWVASIGYSFSGKPISEQDRYLNPLGFQVASYRRDSETTQPIPVAAPPFPASSSPSLTPSPNPMTGAVAGGLTPSGAPAAPAAASTGMAPGALPASTAAPVPSPTPDQKPKTGNPNGEEFPNQ
jgi:type IV secretion system protein VirB8